MNEAIVALVAAAYRAGIRKATTDYAVWKDGEQYVGALRRPLQMVLQGIERLPARAYYDDARIEDDRVAEAVAAVEAAMKGTT